MIQLLHAEHFSTGPFSHHFSATHFEPLEFGKIKTRFHKKITLHHDNLVRTQPLGFIFHHGLDLTLNHCEFARFAPLNRDRAPGDFHLFLRHRSQSFCKTLNGRDGRLGDKFLEGPHPGNKQESKAYEEGQGSPSPAGLFHDVGRLGVFTHVLKHRHGRRLSSCLQPS